MKVSRPLSFAARVYRDRVEMIRADAYWLGVRYADQPIPFWPTDFPAELEGNPSAPMCW